MEQGSRGDGRKNTGGGLALIDRSETLSWKNSREKVRRGTRELKFAGVSGKFR